MDKFNPKEPLTEFSLGEGVATDPQKTDDVVREVSNQAINTRLGLAIILTIEQLPEEGSGSVLGIGIEDLGKILKRNFGRVGFVSSAGKRVENGYSYSFRPAVDGKIVKGVIWLPGHPHLVYEEDKP